MCNMCVVSEYIQTESRFPMFVQGDSLEVLRRISDCSVDCCVTSPPYWQKRQYENGGIGLEASPQEYIDSLFEIIKLILLVSSMIITASLCWTRHCARLLYMLSYITFPMTYEAIIIISILQEQAVDLRSYLCKFKSLTSRREQSLKPQTRGLTVITSQGGWTTFYFL